MLGVIKQKSKDLRTNLKQVLPKFMKFWKYLFIGVISGLIWSLYFIGAAADICEHYLKFIKQELKGKNADK